MALTDALTQLAALTVPGVLHHYAIDELPGTLTRAQLPALLVLPGLPQENAFLRRGGEGFSSLAFSGTSATAALVITHLLLAAPASAALGERTYAPVLVDLIDSYLSVLAGDVTLGGTLAAPARVVVETGIFQRGLLDYAGCAFRHTWVVEY